MHIDLEIQRRCGMSWNLCRSCNSTESVCEPGGLWQLAEQIAYSFRREPQVFDFVTLRATLWHAQDPETPQTAPTLFEAWRPRNGSPLVNSSLSRLLSLRKKRAEISETLGWACGCNEANGSCKQQASTGWIRGVQPPAVNTRYSIGQLSWLALRVSACVRVRAVGAARETMPFFSANSVCFFFK